MNSELALVKFIKTTIPHSRDVNGQEYNEDQANLIETFCYSILEKIHPRVFEKTITETKIKLKSKRRPTSNVKIPLNHLQILHFKLLYNIAFINHHYPSLITNLNLSEDLSELLDNEEEIIKLYEKVRKIGLN